MPQTKRPLAEAPSNAADPPAKRTRGKAKPMADTTASKENEVPSKAPAPAAKKGTAKIKAKEADVDTVSKEKTAAPRKGGEAKAAAEKTADKENAPDAVEQAPKATEDAPQTANASNSSSTNTTAEAKDDASTYITIARPQYDREIEFPDFPEWEDEEQEKLITEWAAEREKYHHKPAAENPEWPWIISKRADELDRKQYIEFTKRHQDTFDMHIYSNWPGYGFQEVIENMLVDYHREFTKKDVSPHVLWSHVHAIAESICSGEDIFLFWGEADIPDTIAATIDVMGKALLSALNALDRASLLKEDTEVPNIGFVMALYLHNHKEFGPDIYEWKGVDGKLISWQHHVVTYASRNNIKLKGIYNIQDYIKDFKKNMAAPKAGEDRWGFDNAFKALQKKHGKPKLGGNQYDITKLTKAQRKKANFHNEDPLTVFCVCALEIPCKSKHCEKLEKNK